MKKLLAVLFSLAIFTILNAQTIDTSKAAADKAAFAKVKQKEKENVDNALKEAGVSAKMAVRFKAIQDEYGKKNSAVRRDTLLSEEQKQKQLDTNTTEKNGKLKELIGAKNYGLYNKVRKKQKDAAASQGKGNK